VACAAGLATLDVYKEEGLFERAADLSPYWEDAVHSLKGTRNVIDLRNLGIIAGIELEPRPGKPTQRAFDAFLKCYEKGLLIRTTGDIIALSPPLIVEKSHVDEMFGTLSEVLRALD
jgi:beta-alanine--pyruvate transaminase